MTTRADAQLARHHRPRAAAPRRHRRRARSRRRRGRARSSPSAPHAPSWWWRCAGCLRPPSIGSRPSGSAIFSSSARSRAVEIEPHLAAEEAVGAEPAEHQIGVGDGRLGAAEAVADRARAARRRFPARRAARRRSRRGRCCRRRCRPPGCRSSASAPAGRWHSRRSARCRSSARRRHG